MVNGGLDISEVIFERGVKLHRDGNVWLSTHNCTVPIVYEPARISQSYHLRPIVVTIKSTPSHSSHFLVPSSSGQFLEISMGQLIQIPFQNAFFTMSSIDLTYVLGAVIYHCHKLAEAYVSVCQDFSRWPILDTTTSPCTFSNQYEPFYEFEALINAAKRVYSTLRRPIWAAFGSHDNLPNSFEKTVGKCTNLPETLKDRLNDSWITFGEKLKDYRDCIEHYTQVGNHIPYALMNRLDNNMWTAWSRIPDNPESRSVSKFRYTGGLDALTYGWSVTNEVVKLTQDVMKQMPS